MTTAVSASKTKIKLTTVYHATELTINTDMIWIRYDFQVKPIVFVDGRR